MTNDEARTTSTDMNLTGTDTDHGHENQCQMSEFNVGNPWKTGKTNSERKGIWAIDPEAWSEGTRGYSGTQEAQGTN